MSVPTEVASKVRFSVDPLHFSSVTDKGDDAAQIGVYDSTKGTNIGYRLFVNNKRATMDHITVVDTLPDGMTFDRAKGIEVTDSSGKAVDASLYSVSISGQELTFSYPGALGDSLAISYWVDAFGGTNIKYTNRAEIYYQSGGTAYQEYRNCVLQGNDHNAACGEKSVDKTVDGAAPKDGQGSHDCNSLILQRRPSSRRWRSTTSPTPLPSRAPRCGTTTATVAASALTPSPSICPGQTTARGRLSLVRCSREARHSQLRWRLCDAGVQRLLRRSAPVLAHSARLLALQATWC